MKRSSTEAAPRKRNFDQKLTVGLDLGDRSSGYCVLDESGEVVGEQKLGTTPKAMREVFAAMPRSRMALETGMHSPWVSRLLSELGHEVIVAHAPNVRLIGESRHMGWVEKPREGVGRDVSIITTSANALVSGIHDRMPVILERENYDVWLDPGFRKVEPLLDLLMTYRADSMRQYRVSTRVNSAQNNDPACAENTLRKCCFEGFHAGIVSE
jgi:hypothetical protein